jgi:hypothetical protein
MSLANSTEASKVYYCRGWFRARKIPTEPLSEAQARAAHESHTLYTALIGNMDHPQCFVEVTGDSMGVGFLDSHLREYVCFNFQERRPGLLFLSMAVFRKFEGDSDKIRETALYLYQESGETLVDKDYFLPTHETWEANTTLDVSANWERYPKFGDYESITRLDRGLQLIH